MNAKEFSINDQTKNFEEFRKQYKELEIKNLETFRRK